MKKVFRVVVYLFVITTLFAFNSNVFASEAQSEETTEDVLNKIVDKGSVMTYIETDNDGNQLMEEYYVFSTKGLENNFEPSTGYVTVNGKQYTFAITFQGENGSNVITSSNIFTEDDGSYTIRLDSLYGKPSDSTSYTYSLIPVDDGGGSSNVASVTNKIKNGKTKRIDIESGKGFWGKVAHLLVEILCGITIPAGDSYVHMISTAIGEPVTIDAVVFNDIQKLSIDFFDGTNGEVTLSNGTKIMPLKNILKDTVNTWYGYFRNIVLIFYMAMLVYMGIKILITSTANKKAIYKKTLSAWVMGIAMLMFFPYVMKYAIKLNDAFCKAVRSDEGGSETKSTANVNISFWKAKNLYGNDGFIMLMLGSDVNTSLKESNQNNFANTAVANGVFKGNYMMEIRFIAAHTSNFMLVIIYFILIGETLALLIMYYKRVFMLAFLITIFPIVVATYPLNKIGDLKMNTFGVWFKEFIVNVFVQSFHAVTYVVVVSVGINAYFTDQNWLLMIMCILFLFQGEKIIRGIFGAKSSINSIGDMAAAGMMAVNLARNATKFIPSIGGKSDSGSDNSTKKAAADRKAARANPGANTPGAQTNASEVDNITNSTNGTSGADSEVQLGRATGTNPTQANKSLNDNYDNKRSKFDKVSGIIGSGVSGASQVVGGLSGFTFGMAQNDGRGPSGIEKGFKEAIQGSATGKMVGVGAYNMLKAPISKTVGVVGGLKLASEYKSGEHDDEIFTDADKALDDAQKEALRKAYAQAARRKGAGFDNSAEIKIMKARVEQSKK